MAIVESWNSATASTVEEILIPTPHGHTSCENTSWYACSNFHILKLKEPNLSVTLLDPASSKPRAWRMFGAYHQDKWNPCHLWMLESFQVGARSLMGSSRWHLKHLAIVGRLFVLASQQCCNSGTLESRISRSRWLPTNAGLNFQCQNNFGSLAISWASANALGQG